MTQHIKAFIGRFRDRDFAILWSEALLFSGVLGIGFRSWLIFGLAFAGLNCLIQQRNGRWYAMLAVCGIWGFIAAAIGHSFGGWTWAAILGGAVFIKGILVHKRKLKLPWTYSDFTGYSHFVQWRQKGQWEGQNMN